MSSQYNATINIDIEAEVRRHVKNMIPALVRVASANIRKSKQITSIDAKMEVISIMYLSQHNLSLESMRKKDNTEYISDHRNVLMYILRVYYEFSSTEVGRFLNRNHATILSGVKQIRNAMDVYPSWKARINKALELY